jgi:hypothetical protein
VATDADADPGRGCASARPAPGPRPAMPASRRPGHVRRPRGARATSGDASLPAPGPRPATSRPGRRLPGSGRTGGPWPIRGATTNSANATSNTVAAPMIPSRVSAATLNPTPGAARASMRQRVNMLVPWIGRRKGPAMPWPNRTAGRNSERTAGRNSGPRQPGASLGVSICPWT